MACKASSALWRVYGLSLPGDWWDRSLSSLRPTLPVPPGGGELLERGGAALTR